MSDQASFLDADGVEISYRHWRAVGTQRAAVVVAHGASEHSCRYDRFADVLANGGYTVLAPDHRGHGRTAASTGPGLTGPRGLAGILDDLDQVVGMASTAVRGAPVALFGHSMGSIFALRCAQRNPSALSALILSGPIGVMPGVDDMIAGLQSALGAGMGDATVDALTPFNAAFEPARTPFDWLSRDESEVDAYIADPLCGDGVPLSYGYVYAMSEALRDGARDVSALAGTVPVLFLAGERDAVSNFTAQARELASLMRAAGVEVTEKYYPGARHEVLNEINRDEVHADVIRWLNALHLPRSSVGANDRIRRSVGR
ncbi:MAG: alpha/beta fold hydrolase [Trebonia sp.]